MNIVFWGASVGKTSLLTLITTGKFSEVYHPTIGADFLRIGDKKFWDTGGTKKFEGGVHFVLQNAHVVFLCFDACDKISFEKIKKDIEELKEFKNQVSSNCKFVLVETKCDLTNPRVVSEEDITQVKVDHFILDHIKTSAKTGEGIQKINFIIGKSAPPSLKQREAQESPKGDSRFLLNACITCGAIGGIGLIIAAYVANSAYSNAFILAGGGLLVTSGFFKHNTKKYSPDELVNLNAPDFIFK